jgi:uncharacterized protein YprB with RNaseH-like and TPR domain
MMAAWAAEPAIAHQPLDTLAFLDTETTGLSGGAGTFAFMVGIGRFEGDEFRLAQFFLREPGEESAQLAAIESFLGPCKTLVTFNGKSFDIPLLNSRYTLHNWPSPLPQFGHLDLLHLARRLWKNRLPSRRLGDLEVDILGAARGEEEVPGWMVPEMYTDYLRTGDAEPLKGVFYHNAWDILSLAALLNFMCQMLNDPVEKTEHDLDLLAVGRLNEDLGRIAEASELYAACIQRNADTGVYKESLQRLALIHKKADNWDEALPLWEEAAGMGVIEAHVELAKYFEHREKTLETAQDWTQAALDRILTRGYPIIERFQWRPELEHRLGRLERKLGSSSNQ